jgi:signal peptidase I
MSSALFTMTRLEPASPSSFVQILEFIMSDLPPETPVVSSPPPAPVKGKKQFRNVGDYLWREWVRPIGEAVIIALVITTFVFTTVAIQGSSDMPNIRDGERVFVPKYETWLTKLGVMSFNRGDLVVLKPPKEYGRVAPIPVVGNFVQSATYKPFYIKRIVAVPGDKVRLEKGQLFVNDIKVNEVHTVPYWKARQNFDDCSYLANSDFWTFRDTKNVPKNRPESPCGENTPAGYKAQNFQLSKTQYFVMGDNRSPGGSEDSRAFGPVKLEEIAGRATFVWWPPVNRDEKTGQIVFNMRTLPRPAAFQALNSDEAQPAMPATKNP